MSADNAALDAAAGRLLAALAGAHGKGGHAVGLARSLAGDLRDEFPGRDAEIARVLALTVLMPTGLGQAVTKNRRRPPGEVPQVLPGALGCAAGDPCRDGATR